MGDDGLNLRWHLLDLVLVPKRKAIKVVLWHNFYLHVHAGMLLRLTKLSSTLQFAQEWKLTLRL